MEVPLKTKNRATMPGCMCAQSCLALWDPRACMRFSQARILKWVAISFPRGSSPPGGLSKPGIKTSSFVSPALIGDLFFFFFFLTTEPPRKPRTTICSSNSTPGHLSREKHNSNRHTRNLNRVTLCCAVVNLEDEGHAVQEGRG